MSPSRFQLGAALGINQTLSWGMTFYLPAIIADPVMTSFGRSGFVVLGAFSWALLVAGACAPRVGKWIDRHGGRGALIASIVVIALGQTVLALESRPGALVSRVDDHRRWHGDGSVRQRLCYRCRIVGEGGGTEHHGDHVGGRVREQRVLDARGCTGWGFELARPAAGLRRTDADGELADDLATGAAGAASDGPRRGRGRVAEVTRRTACVGVVGGFLRTALVHHLCHIGARTSLLQGIGLTAAEAVGIAALIGPGQVAGRILEYAIGPRVDLLTKARIAALLFPAGAALLLLGGPVGATGFVLMYGMSNGIMTVNRGTLPLALFGPEGYARILGWLAVPVLLAQATAPTVSAPLVTALPALDVLLICGGGAAAAVLLLLPLRLPDLGPN